MEPMYFHFLLVLCKVCRCPNKNTLKHFHLFISLIVYIQFCGYLTWHTEIQFKNSSGHWRHPQSAISKKGEIFIEIFVGRRYFRREKGETFSIAKPFPRRGEFSRSIWRTSNTAATPSRSPSPFPSPSPHGVRGASSSSSSSKSAQG